MAEVADDVMELVKVSVFNNQNHIQSPTYPFVINFVASHEVLVAMKASDAYREMCESGEIMKFPANNLVLAVQAKNEAVINHLRKELGLQYDAKSFSDAIEKISSGHLGEYKGKI